MDIVRSFTDGAGVTVEVNIMGDPDAPLFQANQIGQLLGLHNIHTTMKNFDDDEKDAIHTVDSTGRRQAMMFLTHRGLYRLLFASRKPQARPFQIWVADVLEDIRRTGRYETEKRIDQAIKDASAAAEKARHDVLIACNDETSCVYVAVVMRLSDGVFVVKLGETGDIRTRMAGLKTQYGMAVLLDVFKTVDAHVFEQALFRTPALKELKYEGLVNNHRGIEFFLVDEKHTYNGFFRPLIRKKFEDHARTVSSLVEDRRLCLEDRRLRNEETRLRIEETRVEFERQLVMEAIESNRLDMLAGLYCPAKPSVMARDDASERAPVEDADASDASASAPMCHTAHRPTDKRVQQYDASLKLVAVHDGLREAARAVPGGVSSGVRTACVSNALYLGYRWHLVDRDDRSSESQSSSLAPTEHPKHRSGSVAQLALDRLSVVAVHRNQKAAAESVGLASSTSITNALRFDRPAALHRWAWFADLDETLRQDWNDDDLPVQRRGHEVEQIDVETGNVIRTFRTMTEACHSLQASHKMLHVATANDSVYKGFRWRVK